MLLPAVTLDSDLTLLCIASSGSLSDRQSASVCLLISGNSAGRQTDTLLDSHSHSHHIATRKQDAVSLPSSPPSPRGVAFSQAHTDSKQADKQKQGVSPATFQDKDGPPLHVKRQRAEKPTSSSQPGNSDLYRYPLAVSLSRLVLALSMHSCDNDLGTANRTPLSSNALPSPSSGPQPRRTPLAPSRPSTSSPSLRYGRSSLRH